MTLAELIRLLEGRDPSHPIVVMDIDANMESHVETVAEEKDRIRLVVKSWEQKPRQPQG